MDWAVLLVIAGAAATLVHIVTIAWAAVLCARSSEYERGRLHADWFSYKGAYEEDSPGGAEAMFTLLFVLACLVFKEWLFPQSSPVFGEILVILVVWGLICKAFMILLDGSARAIGMSMGEAWDRRRSKKRA
jgi:hypothetical protein